MENMIFKPAARYPADPRAVFILALSVFSGLTALALEAAPPSLEAALPRWGVITWGALLTFGSALTLLGMAFQNLDGILVEQLGSAVVAAATIFYSVIALSQVGVASLQTGVGIIMAWGLSCIVRWIQLQVLIRDGVKRAEKQKIVDRLVAEIEARNDAEMRERVRRRHDER